MNAWKIPFVIGIRTSGENHLKTSSRRRLKHPVFYALVEELLDQYLFRWRQGPASRKINGWVRRNGLAVTKRSEANLQSCRGQYGTWNNSDPTSARSMRCSRLAHPNNGKLCLWRLERH